MFIKIPPVYLLVLLAVTTCFRMESSVAEKSSAIPGRVEYEGVAVAEFGKTKLFFYMTPEKHRAAKEFIHDVSETLLHTTVAGELDFPVIEVTPVATKFRDPIRYDQNNKPVYVDDKGMAIYEAHAKKVHEIAEKALGVKIHGRSQEMSLIINFDANKFHQDQFVPQYEFLKKHPLPIPQYILFQDLTLIDWEMAKGTFSATVLQDEESDDRFAIALFPSEVACAVYTQPAIYAGPNTPPEYPGAKTLPPHSPVAPIDRNGDTTSGSAKGKRISVAVRGLVLKEEMDALQSRSKALPINRYVASKSPEGKNVRQYPNGIVLKEFPKSKPLNIDIAKIFPLDDIENMEVFTTRPEANKEAIAAVQQTFGLKAPLKEVRVVHLIKKDGGFSKLNLEALRIPKGSKVVLVNSAKIPKGYDNFPIAEDFTSQGIPWIQFYHFPKEMAMMVPERKLKNLSLSPAEEIIFRNSLNDIACTNPNLMNEKIVNQIDLFIFPK